MRPVRKKASSSARSPAGSGDSPLNHGSPEEFQPASSQPGSQAQPPSDPFIDHLGSPSQSFVTPAGAFGVGVGVGAQGFADAGMGLMQTDPGPMSAADIMAFLNADPSLDVGAILGSPDLGGSLDHQPNGFYHMGTPTPGGVPNPLSP